MGAQIQTEPGVITSLVEGALTTQYYIQVLWTNLDVADMNGAAVISFNLQSYEKRSDGTLMEWQDLLGHHTDTMQTQYVISTGINVNSVYNFRIRAKNMWGWGAWSSTLEVQPSARPSTVDFDLYNHSDGTVKIAWYEPDWHNTQVDREFKIEIQHKNDNSLWFEDVVNCNGRDPIYLGEETCSYLTGGCACFVPMS